VQLGLDKLKTDPHVPTPKLEELGQHLAGLGIKVLSPKNGSYGTERNVKKYGASSVASHNVDILMPTELGHEIVNAHLILGFSAKLRLNLEAWLESQRERKGTIRTLNVGVVWVGIGHNHSRLLVQGRAGEPKRRSDSGGDPKGPGSRSGDIRKDRDGRRRRGKSRTKSKRVGDGGTLLLFFLRKSRVLDKGLGRTRLIRVGCRIE